MVNILPLQKMVDKTPTDFTKCGEKIFKTLNYNQKNFLVLIVSPLNLILKKSRNMKTLRDISNIKNEYKKIINY